jgi:hypothetical protein
MDEFVDLSPKHPSAVAYKKVRESVKKAPTKPDRATAWKDRLTGNFKIRTTTHYAALYNSRDGEVDVENRLARLEQSFKNFFYWFAFKGIALTPPDQKLVVIFVDKPEEYAALYQAFDAPLLSGDGFLARRENIGIYCMTPVDEAYDMLAKSSAQAWTVEKWNKTDLLLGRFKAGETPAESAYHQEVALLLKAMQDEGELQAVTNVGAQQLLGSLGMVPGSVSVPLWLQSGLGSFFETPKGYYWPGVGAPHWRYLVNFRNWRDDKKLEKPEDVVLNTITDQYFVMARQTANPLERAALLEKAHTMSWALTYYLLDDQNMREGFFKYLEELAKLPRDMEVNRESYLVCFVRAFGLLKETDPSRIDLPTLRDAIKKPSHEWYYRYMSTKQLEIADVWTVSKKTEDQKAAKLVEAAEAAKKGTGTLPPQPGVPMPPMPRRPMP